MISKTNLSSTSRRNFVRGLAGGAGALFGLTVVSRLQAFASAERPGVTASSRATGTKMIGGQEVPYIYWSWGEIRRGDCTIAPGSIFYLFANGATRWVCDLRSSDSGDEWDGNFEIKNANNQVLAATAKYHFDISQDNVTRHWDESRGPNPSLAAAYPSAKSVIFNCSC